MAFTPASTPETDSIRLKICLVLLLIGIPILYLRALILKPNESPRSIADLPTRLAFLIRAPAVLSKFYHQFGGQTFWISTLFSPRHLAVICTPELITELTEVSENVLSFSAWVRQRLQLDLLAPGHMDEGPWPASHFVALKWVKKAQDRDLKDTVIDLVDEMQAALKDEVEEHQEPVKAYVFVKRVIARTITRVQVGKELCRDKTFIEAQIDAIMEIGRGSYLVGRLPQMLKGVVARWLVARKCRKTVRIALEKLRDERLAMMEKGEPVPNDLFQELLENMDKRRYTFEGLFSEYLLATFANMFGTSSTLTATLLELVARKEYHQPLREEVESLISENGWTLKALDAMHGLDSFMKEVHRFNPISHVSMMRYALEPYTFSDGTELKPGDHIGALAGPRYQEASLYPSPTEFDGFRFSKLREAAKDDTLDVTFTEASPKWLMFGGGKHVCPGRYSAKAMSKMLLAMVLMEYDVELQGEPKSALRSITVEENTAPNSWAKVVIRRK